ncbi:MAG TPA: methyltransferase domain-containing protein [Dyella sp.]|uniref:methyltransferase domain-containing protein n=1 Tax=Dyella sp. TaxID=1869338 RepID=UPI002F924E22
MAQRDNDIYASTPLHGLIAEEAVALSPDLQRCAGKNGLLLTALSSDMSPSLPLLDHWVRLTVGQGLLYGDVRGRADEPLPFLDESFELVMLRHALEVAPVPRALLDEAVRVLSPGGTLALTGVHPFSLWNPWLRWRRRHAPVSLFSPLVLESWLRVNDLSIERIQRVGRWRPGAAEEWQVTPVLGGGYVLVARKQRHAATPIRLRPRAVAAPVGVGLAPGARRSAA